MKTMKRFTALALIFVMILSSVSMTSAAPLAGEIYVGNMDGSYEIEFPYAQSLEEGISFPFGLSYCRDGVPLVTSDLTYIDVYDPLTTSYKPMITTFGLEPGNYFAVAFGFDEYGGYVEVDMNFTIRGMDPLIASSDLDIDQGEERILSGEPLATYDGVNGDGILYYYANGTQITETELLTPGSYNLYAEKLGYLKVDFVLNVNPVDQPPVITFFEGDQLNVTWNAIIPFDAMVTAIDPEEGLKLFVVEEGHSPYLDTSNTGMVDITYMTGDDTGHEVTKVRHMNVVDEDISDGFYILNNLEKIVQKVDGLYYYEELFRSPLDFNYVKDAAMNSAGEIFVALGNNTNSLVKVYNLNDLTTPITQGEDIIAIEYDSDDILHLANADTVYYYSNGYRIVSADPSDNIVDFDFDNTDEALFVMTNNGSVNRLHFFEGDDITHSNQNIPQSATHFIFADEKLVFMEEMIGSAKFTVLDERFNMIRTFERRLNGLYSQTVLANTYESDFDVHYNYGIAHNFMEWEFGSAVWNPSALQFVLRDKEMTQLYGSIVVVDGHENAYMENMTLRMIKGGNVLLKATYEDQTEYVSISLIEKQNYYIRHDYALLENGISEYVFHIYHTDEHWDTTTPGYEDTKKLAELYYKNEANEEIMLAGECLIDTNPISDTRSLTIGSYSGEFKPQAGQETHWFKLFSEQDKTFGLVVENSPPQVTFYDDPLYLFEDTIVSSLLGAHVTDAEMDTWYPVILEDSQNLVYGNFNLDTDTSNNGLVEFGYKMTEESEASEDVIVTRNYHIEPYHNNNGIAVTSLDGLVIQDTLNDRTYCAYGNYGTEGELRDVAVDSYGNTMLLFEYEKGSGIKSYNGNPLLINYEEDIKGLSYDFYNDLYTTIKFNEEEITLELVLLSEENTDIYSFNNRIVNLTEIFASFDCDASCVDVKDIAFNQRDLYILYDYMGITKLILVPLEMIQGGYMYMGDAEVFDLNENYIYEGLAYHDDEIYLTVSPDIMLYPFDQEMLNEYTTLRPFSDMLAVLTAPTEDEPSEFVHELDKYFGNATGASGMVMEKVILPDRIDLEVGLLAMNKTFVLVPEVHPFTIELGPDNYSTTGNYFDFDKDTGLVTAVSPMPEGDVGGIYVNLNGTQYFTPVYVQEKNPTIDILGPDYVEKDAYLRGDYGLSIPGSGDLRILASNDGTDFLPIKGFILDTSTNGNQTAYYRFYNDMNGYAGVEDYLEIERHYTVVQSEKRNITIHLDDDGYLFYRDHLHDYYVYAEDMGYRTEQDYNFRDVAVDSNDVLYLLAYDTIVVYNNEDHSSMIYTEEKSDENGMYRSGYTAIDFGPDGSLYLGMMNGVYLIELDEDTQTFNVIMETILDDEYEISDLLISPNNDYLYIVSNDIDGMHGSLETAQGWNHTARVAKYALNDMTLQAFYEVSEIDEIPRFVGLTMIENVLFVDIITGLNNDNRSGIFDKESLEDQPYPIAHPIYATFLGAASRYPTMVLASDMQLQIGYQKSTSDGEKRVDYLVYPFDRVTLPPVISVFDGENNIQVIGTDVVKGLSAGSGIVKISVDGAITYIDVDVEFFNFPPNNDVVTISVTPDPIEVEYGPGADPENLTLLANASVSGSNQNVTWTIADETVATVDGNGLVTAISTGETTLTARVAGVSDTVEVIVFFIDDELDPLGLVEFNEPYVSGFPNNMFGPKKPVTRAELATMFSRILNLDTGTTSASYNDLNNHWASKYILAATDANIFKGYGNGLFKPDQSVTRAELAATISNYWQYFKVDVDSSPLEIKDVSLKFWASTYIYRLYNTELITGYEDGTFKPDEMTLREDVVEILNNLIGREVNVSNESIFDDVNDSNPKHGAIEAASLKSVIKTDE